MGNKKKRTAMPLVSNVFYGQSQREIKSIDNVEIFLQIKVYTMKQKLPKATFLN